MFSSMGVRLPHRAQAFFRATTGWVKHWLP